MVTFYTLPDGCSKHSCCTTCPFPDCIAPQKDIIKATVKESKHNEIRRLHSIGLSVSEIMTRTGYRDKGTVQSIIRERR